MTTESLLDQSRKFVTVGPDEKIWVFSFEAPSAGTVHEWQAYSKTPDSEIFVPEGPWSEAMVLKFIGVNWKKLNDSDRIDLFLFLHKGGLEHFLQKSRKETHD